MFFIRASPPFDLAGDGHLDSGLGDDLHSDLAALRRREKGGAVRESRIPAEPVDTAAEGLLQTLHLPVVAGVGEVDSAGVEAQVVVVGVDHPASDVPDGPAVQSPGAGVEGVETQHLYL